MAIQDDHDMPPITMTCRHCGATYDPAKRRSPLCPQCFAKHLDAEDRRWNEIAWDYLSKTTGTTTVQ
jgi:hypothetical protein